MSRATSLTEARLKQLRIRFVLWGWSQLYLEKRLSDYEPFLDRGPNQWRVGISIKNPTITEFSGY